MRLSLGRDANAVCRAAIGRGTLGAMDPSEGALWAGRFTLERAIFEGGMGTVWRARDASSGAMVALKLMSLRGESARQRFEREARVLASLAHPHIVAHVAHGSDADDQPYLAMEWIEGEDLDQRFERGPLSLVDTLELARLLAEALGFAHLRGVVHRDLKPANVLLPGGQIAGAKLSDFGVARWRTAAPVSLMTQLGMIIGTPGYMAPEQARGADQVDGRADLFSLGCLLYEALSGVQAFTGDSLVAVLAKVLVDEPRPLGTLRRDAPPALIALIADLMAKEPNARPRDAHVVLERVAAIRSELDPTRAIDLSELERGRAAPARAPLVPSSLTPTEQRLAAVVIVQPSGGELLPDRTIDDAITAGSESAEARRALMQRLARVAAPFAGRFEALAHGAVLLVLTGGGEARDLAARAAHAALAMAHEARGHRTTTTLALGRARLDGGWPEGEVIDDAARLARAPSDDGVVITDRATAALLGSRFELDDDRAADRVVLRRCAELGDARTVLGRATPHVGRAQELALLDATLRECVDEPVARVVVVRAAAGFGKSRLRREWLQTLADREPPIVLFAAGADELRQGASLGHIAEALRRAAGLLDGEPLDQAREKIRARIALRVDGAEVARLSAFLGELAGVPFDDALHPGLAAARADAALMADLVREAFVDLLFYETRSQPVVLVLEDLHWADAGTVQLLDDALHALMDAPLFVLALARPEVDARFPALFAAREPRVIELAGLGKRASEKLVRDVLGAGAEPRDIERVVTLAAGNPFHLEELVRAVAEGRGESLPMSVLASVQARLEELDPEQRRTLRAASVFGEVFWSGGVARLLGATDTGDTERILRELAGRELLVSRIDSRFPGETEHAFRHALVREAAYAMSTPQDRALGHALAAAWLEERGETNELVVAEHTERGGDPQRAAAAFVRAARRALFANDLDGAAQLVDRGLVHVDDDATRGSLLLLRAEILRTRAENATARAAAREALTLLQGGGEEWFQAMRELVLTSSRLGDIDGLAALVDRLVAHFSPAFAGAAAMQTIATAGAQLLLAGRTELSERLLALLPAEAALSEPRTAGTVARARALRALFAGDLAGFVAGAERSVAAYRLAGDSRNVDASSQYLAYGYDKLGAYAEAEKRLREALATVERRGRSELAAAVLQNLAHALHGLGRFEEARELAVRSLETALRQGDARVATGARIYLALTLSALGAHADAATHALDATASATTDALNAYAHGVLARVQLAAGELEDARTSGEQALGLLERAKLMDEGEALVRLAVAEARHATGDLSGARAAILVARTRLMASASSIADASWRARFLEHVAEHQRTLELATAWE